MAADGVGLFGCACGFEGYTGGSSLPGWCGAGGVGWSVFHLFVDDVLALDRLLENGLTAVDLGYDCVDFFAVIGDSAISGVVAVPTDGGVEDVKVGQIDERDVAGRAIDQEPSAGLPLPVGRGRGFLWKAIVDAKGAADYEEAIGYVVSGAQREFLDAGVDEKRADFQSERLFVGCAGTGLGKPLHGGPFAESDNVRSGRGDGACLSDEDGERQCYGETRSRDADHV